MPQASILLQATQAIPLFEQFQETERVRNYRLWAVAIMANHIHLICRADKSVTGEKLLADFKSYGSRRLSIEGKPISGTWWTQSGSKRRLIGDESLLRAIRYTRTQFNPFLIWTTDVPELGYVAGLQVPSVSETKD
ncbi:MAG: transposase [Pirellulales bacterium]